MGEGDKIAGEFSRSELAAQLEALAKKLRMGKFRLGEQVFQVVNRLETKIRLKEKNGQIRVKLRFQFPVSVASDETTAPETTRRQKSFKEVKKQLGQAFADLIKADSQAAFPEEGEILEYLELSKEFARYADPAWEAEMQEYLKHAENMRLAYQNRQFEMFRHELRDLQNRMNTCHRNYK